MGADDRVSRAAPDSPSTLEPLSDPHEHRPTTGCRQAVLCSDRPNGRFSHEPCSGSTEPPVAIEEGSVIAHPSHRDFEYECDGSMQSQLPSSAEVHFSVPAEFLHVESWESIGACQGEARL